ncbi:CHAT domain-containing protein [Amycolatopsis sp. QT-25]|uniref:CHAT domain-containing protein n=1 Tax=Amycolatopsis sp. QT-25 TaxID=3034022 RepID=UPI0023ED8017|nr:CHAT domain-containing protein [Amycolatopsis sp. QT-25]WET76213.1 CHAT domain-containing protein [Amycolatopsis sp. QT-25]
MENGPDAPAEVEVVTRCRATVDAMAAGAVESTDVSSFLAELNTLPEGHPQRSELAATMVTLLTKGGGAPPMKTMSDLGALLSMVDTAPPHLLAWPQARDSGRAFQLAHEVQHREVDDAAAIAELDELANRQADAPPTLKMIEAARRAVRLSTAFHRGDQSSISDAAKALEDLIDRAGDVPQAAPLREMQATMRDYLRTMHTGDWGKVRDLLGRLGSNAAALGLDPTDFALPVEGEALLNLVSGPEPDHSELTTDEIIRKYAGVDAGAGGKLAATIALLRGGDETDLIRIDRAIELTREAADEPGPLRDAARNGIALGLWQRAEVLGTTEGLDEAQQVLEDLIDDMRGRGGPANRLWTDVHHMLAQIRRRVGNRRESDVAGLEAMYRFAHQALVESDPAVARIGLREAATSGMDFARQCLVTGDYARAMDALDAGRGLMLFAEVEVLDLVPRLRAAGRDDLARRWEVEGPMASGLRAEAIEVLVAAAGGVDKLLKLPTPSEVRAALRAVDADALVYLVPTENQQGGMALVVPREGPMAYLPLPYLRVRKEAEAEGYLAALSELSRELSPAAQAPFTDRLDELCEWAWRVAIGPLLERYFTRDAEKRDRTPRIVLIPMAELAAIPWQAARNAEGTYAVELAAFSQAVSAREFCANATRPPVRLTSTGLVVGDPRTEGLPRDLPAARLEAFEVHKAFLRAAKYVGRRPNGSVSPSGPGTAEQVRAWLAADKPQAGAVLHLACHGQFTSDEQTAKASLLLAPDPAGGHGELGADEIVRLLNSNPNRQIGLVVMAACHTGRSIHGYDEAYSLGTAFLAGGVRTVLSTQWAVPDEATSMLMYLFHHYLRTERLPPWQALRAAQLCMLRPETPVPDAMPAHLRELVGGREHAGVVGWAGFIHGGH